MLFIDEIKQFLPNLNTIIEAGCHRGEDVKYLRKTWPNAEIYAFEADPYNYEICKPKFDDDPKTHVYNYALSDYSEESTFYRYHPENPVDKIKDEDTFVGTNLQDTGGGSILGPGKFLKLIKHDEIYQKIPVKSISIYDFCNENNTSADALFMDVQGAEFKVLYGSRSYLENIKVIILEWSTNYTYYDGETDFVIIKAWLELNGFIEIKREYQLQHSGDSLFVNKRFVNVSKGENNGE